MTKKKRRSDQPDASQRKDPFASETAHEEKIIDTGLIHIRVIQRQGRKKTTLIQGVPSEFDIKKITKSLKKELACNGSVSEHKEYGEVISLQGDHRQDIYQFLIKYNLARKENIKIHGF
ncbi:hypothetical protein Zmor_012403 [Zophobas morio]|uniref:SUI1 domain-containing protein n=1 Tax=Zophobas morio TaxID=2755281 RepID=A0AA38HIB2_9CUCU|nr:hypothetical protein Zmor_012403 [Zophobas morio]